MNTQKEQNYKGPYRTLDGQSSLPIQTEQRDTPKRGIDYNVYPPSATSDRKGWAVTIGGEYVKVASFATRSDAESYAQTEVLKKRKSAEQRDTTQPDHDEIIRQAGLQKAGSVKWDGWNWKEYQTAIVRQNHHISKIEAHAERLAEALRDCLINNPKHFTPSMNAALVAWEGRQK